MNKLKTSLKRYILEFLTPYEFYQFAKTSSINFKIFKSDIDCELITFYKEFEIIKTDRKEKHLNVLILTAEQIFYTNKFEKTTNYYLKSLVIKYKILFEYDYINKEVLHYFDGTYNNDNKQNLPDKLRYINIDKMSSDEIFEKIKIKTQIEGLTKMIIWTKSIDNLSKETWDLIIDQRYEVRFHFSDYEIIRIRKKSLLFYIDGDEFLKVFNSIHKAEILERFDEIKACVAGFNFDDYLDCFDLRDFLRKSKANCLSLQNSFCYNRLSISNSDVRVLYMDKKSAMYLDDIIENKKGLIVYYLDYQTDEEDLDYLIRFRTKNQINCLHTGHVTIIHSLIYQNKKYDLRIWAYEPLFPVSDFLFYPLEDDHSSHYELYNAQFLN